MNARTAALVPVCAACLFGCSLFLETADFTSGEDPVDAGPTVDATTDTAPASDGGNEAASGDAGRSCPDGGFCDSFERTTLLGEWEDVGKNGACNLEIDTSVASDGASSLKNTVAGTTADGACSAYVFRGFFGAPRKLRLAFSLRMGALPKRRIVLAGIYVLDPDRSLTFAVDEDNLRLAEQEEGANPQYDDHVVASFLSGALTPGTFHRIVLEHDVLTRRTVVTLDDDERLNVTSTIPYDTTDLDVGIGNGYTLKGPPIDLWYDDFEFVPEY